MKMIQRVLRTGQGSKGEVKVIVINGERCKKEEMTKGRGLCKRCERPASQKMCPARPFPKDRFTQTE